MLGAEDHRDHPEGGAVTDARGNKQQHEHAQIAVEIAGLTVLRQKVHHAEDHHDHRHEVPQGHLGTAELVGQPAAQWTHQCTHQWTEEGEFQGDDVREGGFDQQRKRGGKTDE